MSPLVEDIIVVATLGLLMGAIAISAYIALQEGNIP